MEKWVDTTCTYGVPADGAQLLVLFMPFQISFELYLAPRKLMAYNLNYCSLGSIQRLSYEPMMPCHRLKSVHPSRCDSVTSFQYLYNCARLCRLAVLQLRPAREETPSQNATRLPVQPFDVYRSFFQVRRQEQILVSLRALQPMLIKSLQGWVAAQIICQKLPQKL